MSIPKVKLNNGVSIANALNGNNISLGFNEIYYQESSISGWYMGIENPQYTIYARSQVNPVQPNIWATSGTSDTEILNFINRTANVGGVPFTSTTEAFYFVGTRAENFIIKGNYPAITLKDLVLNYDTGTLMGYPWSGNTVYDLSPSQSNTTLSGSPTYNPLYNGILEFNGTNQYGYGPDLGQLSAFTVNTWFRLDSIPNPSEAPAIITEKFISNHLGFVIGFIDSPQNGDISGGFFNNGWYKTASFTPVLSTWYNVTLTYDNASLSLYIDGVLFDSVPVTEPAISSGLGYNVGKRWDSDDFINGQIQVVQIYNRALTDGEISNSYTRFVPRFIPPSATPTPTPENLTPTPTPTPTNTPTNTPTPTNTETPTNTPTPTNTETPTSTPTPTETETPTPTPTNTPTPSSTGSFDELINPIITNNDEYIEVGGSLYLMFAEPIGPTLTPTPTATETPTSTPTSTPTNTPTLTQTPTNTFTLTPTSTVTNTPQPTVTPTITNTPTFTPTPSTSPIPVTGYGYNLVALPYNFPSSGNSIMNAPAPQQTGTTLINELAVTGRGFYFNSLDNIGVNRTSYYSQFTGQSITITFTQNGDSAIYSGDSQSFKFWSTVGDTGFVFGTNIGVPPTNTPSGTAVLIQSATTTWVTGVTVYVSVQNSGPEVTPTQTATSVTPTPTPTSGATNDGWFFYTPEGQVMGAPTNNGNTIFLPPSGGSTFNPNYSGGTFNLFFNGFTSGGTSYVTQFQGLDTTGGTITITQNSVSVSYSGDSTQFSYAPSPNNYLQLQVTSYGQVISSGSTSFISGSPITLTFI